MTHAGRRLAAVPDGVKLFWVDCAQFLLGVERGNLESVEEKKGHRQVKPDGSPSLCGVSFAEGFECVLPL